MRREQVVLTCLRGVLILPFTCFSMTRPMRSEQLLFAACLVVGVGCGDAGDGLVKHQVTGQVFVNGAPEKGIAVTFKNCDPNVPGNAARPVAVTDQDGRYTLSTNGAKDGAVSGTYAVSFFWPKGGDSIGDFFDGKYRKTNGPDYEVVIGESDLEAPPFFLEAPESAVAEARRVLSKHLPMN
jgi:hypothetical protein